MIEKVRSPEVENEAREEGAGPVSGKAQPAARRSPKRRGVLGRIWQSAMYAMRRIHLYTGLLMLPWVLLYGFTALLFNHSSFFPDSGESIHRFQESDHDEMPPADRLAQRVVDELNAQQEEVEEPVAYELVDRSAAYTRTVFASAKGEGRDYTVVLNLDSGSGYVRERERDGEEEETERKKKDDARTPLQRGPTVGIDIAAEKEDVLDAMKETLDRLELPYEQISVQSLPTIEFDVREGDEVRRVRFGASRRGRGSSTRTPDRQVGRVTVVGEGQNEIGWRRYLLRLHTAHGYPVQQNARWYWAIAVDAMFATMMFWGLSGVLMWWQIKRTRWLGAICLVVSAVVAVWLAVGMHQAMVG